MEMRGKGAADCDRPPQWRVRPDHPITLPCGTGTEMAAIGILSANLVCAGWSAKLSTPAGSGSGTAVR